MSTARRLLALAGVPPRRVALAVLLGALAAVCGVGLMATAGYLISRAAEQPPILSLTVTIVAVRFFGLARPLSRYLERLASHDLALRSLARIRARFYERIEPLVRSGKLGPVVWQLPPNFQRDDERLAGALAALPPGRHCFEFRHATWFAEPVYALLRDHGAALVVGDHPRWPFQARELTADWTVIRLHHGHRGRRGNYSRGEIEEWARRAARWRRRADVFVYLNNDWEGFAVENAKLLRRLLRRSRAG